MVADLSGKTKEEAAKFLWNEAIDRETTDLLAVRNSHG